MDGGVTRIAIPLELAAMDVLVTSGAALRRVAEFGLVAIDASHRTVRAGKDESGDGMIELPDVSPGLQSVARVADLARGRQNAEVGAVRVAMARLAAGLGEPVSHRLVFVAFAARNGRMRALQREPAFLMPDQRERGGAESLHPVAVLAAPGRELARVRIAMAIRAPLKRRAVVGFRPGRSVAFRTIERGMPARERKTRALVVGSRERRWPEAPFVVAGGAVAFVFPGAELASVLVAVAIEAAGVGKRRFEVHVPMALEAVDRRVLPGKGETSAVMIEVLRQPDLLPGTRVVTRAAVLRECAAMRILVAGRTRLKFQPLVSNRLAGGRPVALRAFDGLVLACERERGA